MSIQQSQSTDKIIVDKTKRTSAATRVMKETRLNVNNGSSTPIAFEVERLKSYAQNHVNVRIVLPISVILFCIVISAWIGPQVATYFAVMLCCSFGYLIYTCYKFLKIPKDELVIKDWRRRFLVAQLVIAIVTAIYSAFSCNMCISASTYSIVQFSGILMFVAFTMLLSNGFGKSLLVTSAPAVIVLSIKFILSGEAAHMVMGLTLIAAQILFYIMANRFRVSTLSDLSYKAEREGLIAELETAKAMSEEARHRAEEANLAKSRFLATMSHELRTPLNAILGFSEVMKGEFLGPIGNETYKDYVGDIHKSGNHLLNVINEILDLSRIEAGRQDLHEEAIRLSYIIEDAVHMVQLKAKQKQVKILCNYEENMPLIWADEKAIRQVCLNLLSNALKFTPTGGTINIAAGWTSTGGQYLSISDNGPGIAEEEIPIVLSSFGQGSIAIKSAEQGTGLGLPIVQALMTMHDGKFELTSKLREGTKVTATFPRSRVLEIMEKTENTGTEKVTPEGITGMRNSA